MRASRWNTDAEIGGGWRVTLRRQADGTLVELAQPTRMDLWERGLDPATDDPTETIAATLSGDALSASLELTAEQIQTLGRGLFEHRVIVTDVDDTTVVLMRGTMTIRGAAGDL